MSAYGLWLSAAGMKVNQHRQTIHANNMANANTTGFKHDLAVVTERRVESRESPGSFRFRHPVLAGLAGGVDVRPTFHAFDQGAIEPTGRPLDVAIRGDGFFAVTDGQDTRYTRDGEFTTNTDGELVLSAGNGRWHVLTDAGPPIKLDPAGEKVAIGPDGTVRQGRNVLGRIALYTTEDKQSLRKIGENLFEPRDTTMQPMRGTLVPRSREASTYDVMQGLASMIEVSRSYELNSRLLQLQDALTGQAVSTVGRLA